MNRKTLIKTNSFRKYAYGLYVNMYTNSTTDYKNVVNILSKHFTVIQIGHVNTNVN